MSPIDGIFEGTVELTTLDVNGARSELIVLSFEMGPVVFENGKCLSEDIYYTGYDELTQSSIEGLCIDSSDLVVGITQMDFPPNRTFAVESILGERENRLGYRFPIELRYELHCVFFNSFVNATKERGWLINDNRRIQRSSGLLSTDFNDHGLGYLRKHYHPLCLEVLQRCSVTEKSKWPIVIDDCIAKFLSFV